MCISCIFEVHSVMKEEPVRAEGLDILYHDDRLEGRADRKWFLLDLAENVDKLRMYLSQMGSPSDVI